MERWGYILKLELQRMQMEEYKNVDEDRNVEKDNDIFYEAFEDEENLEVMIGQVIRWCGYLHIMNSQMFQNTLTY